MHRPAAAFSADGRTEHAGPSGIKHGEKLITWSVGTGWQKGGQLGWLVLDSAGQATGRRGMKPGIPVWGFSAAYAEGDRFVILY